MHGAKGIGLNTIADRSRAGNENPVTQVAADVIGADGVPGRVGNQDSIAAVGQENAQGRTVADHIVQN